MELLPSPVSLRHKELIQARRCDSYDNLEATRLRLKLVFKVKYNVICTFNNFKARLVARGFDQVKNIEFIKTFASTIQFEIVHVIIPLLAESPDTITA